MDVLLRELKFVHTSLDFWEKRSNKSVASLRALLFQSGPLALIRTLSLGIEAIPESLRFARSERTSWLGVLMSVLQQPFRWASSHAQQRVQALHSLSAGLATAIGYLSYADDEFGSYDKREKEAKARLHAAVWTMHHICTAHSACESGTSFVDNEEPSTIPCFEDLHKKAVESVAEVQQTIARFQKPKHCSRYWIRYTWLMCFLTALLVRIFRQPHGTYALVQAAHTTVKAFFNEHVAEPLHEIRDEVLNVIASTEGQPSLTSEDLRSTKESLQRMLEGESGINSVLAKFEEQIKAPIYNMIFGDLTQLILIQGQAVKVELEEGILGISAVLSQQRLSLATMALAPALLVFLGTLSAAITTVRAACNRREKHLRFRLRYWAAEAERALQQAQQNGKQTAYQQGFVVYAVQNLLLCAKRIWISKEEYEELSKDTSVLMRTRSVDLQEKLQTAERMRLLNAAFKP